MPGSGDVLLSPGPLLAQRHRMRGHPVARLTPATWSPTAATSPAASTPSAIGGRVPRSQSPVRANSSQLPTAHARTSIKTSSGRSPGKLQELHGAAEPAHARSPHRWLLPASFS